MRPRTCPAPGDKFLWLQEAVRSRKLEINKVLVTVNIADVATKPKTAKEISEQVSRIGGTLHRRTNKCQSHTCVDSCEPCLQRIAGTGRRKGVAVVGASRGTNDATRRGPKQMRFDPGEPEDHKFLI